MKSSKSFSIFGHCQLKGGLGWIAALLMVVGGACSREGSDEVPEPSAASSPSSLRHLGQVPDFAFIDHDGDVVASHDLEKRVWVANFIFTRCASTCPIQTAKFAELQKVLKEKPYWSALRMLSFTVDPEHDTPQVLSAYAEAQQAEANWRFLTGERETLWRFCKQGLKLPVEDNGLDPQMPILHSPRVILVDGSGQIRGYYDGLDGAALGRLQKDLEVALRETSSLSGYDRAAFPKDTLDPAWLETRRQAQLARAVDYAVFHEFRFEDRVRESGVTFRNRVVDDACKINIAGHYDHGNGIAAADVDGDGLVDIYLTTQVGANGLWKNLGGGRFLDITGTALAMADRISVTASFADTDNDGDADLFVTSVRGGNAFFENDGDGHFTERTEASGLDYRGHSSAGVFFDYDNDGWLDLFLCNIGVYTDATATGRGGYHKVLGDAFAGHLKPEQRNETSILYRNEGANRFVDVTEKAGLVDTSWSGDASPLDLNEDGWMDLYVLNMQGHDAYYENLEGQGFRRRSREFFPRTPWGSMGIQVFDYNNDGRMDLYITDMHSDMSQPIPMADEKRKSKMKWSESFLQSGGNSIFGNAFYRNDGGGAFTEVSDAVGAENYWPWGLSVGDLNADGFEDAFLTSSMNYPFRYAVNSLLLNGAGQGFYDCEFVLGVEPRRDGRTARPIFTLDPKGADRDHQMVDALKLERPAEIWGALGSRSSVLVDLDQDGDLDIFTNEFNDGPMILISDLEARRPLSWLAVTLRGSGSNRDGLGAKVVVKVGNRRFTRLHHGQSGYLSQSRCPLYFGLGEATQVDEITVEWPSGTRQTVPGPIELNRQLQIAEPSES